MPNPIFTQGVDALENFLGFGVKSNIEYDKYLSNTVSPRMDKALEERGYLRFHYPDTGSNDALVRTLPFFEDPVIRENRGATYSESKIFLRNEPYRAFTGADARKFTMEFNFTLPHIATYYNNWFGGVANEKEKQEVIKIKSKIRSIIFRDYRMEGELPNKLTALIGSNPQVVISADKGPGDGPRLPLTTDINLGNDEVEKRFYEIGYGRHWLSNDHRTDFEPLVNHFLNILRTSVLSTSNIRGATYGPPIFLLKWGAVYDHIPCIMKRYDIEFRGDYGWQNETLYPKVLRIKIEAEEFRQSVGNFHGPINEKVPGWDEIFKYGGDIPSKLK